MSTPSRFVVGWFALGFGWFTIIVVGLVVLPGQPTAVQNWSVGGFAIGAVTVWMVGRIWKHARGTRKVASSRRPEG